MTWWINHMVSFCSPDRGSPWQKINSLWLFLNFWILFISTELSFNYNLCRTNYLIIFNISISAPKKADEIVLNLLISLGNIAILTTLSFPIVYGMSSYFVCEGKRVLLVMFCIFQCTSLAQLLLIYSWGFFWWGLGVSCYFK